MLSLRAAGGIGAALLLLLTAAGCGRSTLLPIGFDADVVGTLDQGMTDGGMVDRGVPDCNSDADCSDGLVCNGPERCLPEGICGDSPPLGCEDDIECTVDSCVEPNGCQSIPDSSLCPPGNICVAGRGCVRVPCRGADECQDGSTCNGREECSGGFCTPGVPLVCDTADPCTDGICREPGGCIFLEIDRDRDGFGPVGCPSGTDCNDGDPLINPGVDEVCDDDIDNDCNDAVDCDDMSCAMEPFCDTCDFDDISGVGLVASGTTVGADNDFTPSCSGGSRAPDRVFRWTAPSTADYGFGVGSFSGTRFDPVLLLATDCPGRQLACNDGTDIPNTAAVERRVAAGETVFVVVDGQGAQAGNFQLFIGAQPEVCDDGVDNDGDGSVDCDDADCVDSDLCCTPVPEICDDDIDNDCDELVDCDDPMCTLAPECRPCPDDDLGTVLGVAVATGSTVGQVNDTQPTCGSPLGAAPDFAYEWTAPFTGEFLIDTNGSGFDTILYVLDGCGGPELACDDDDGVGNNSELRIDLDRGDTVLLVVDGFGAFAGNYELNIAAIITGEFLCNDMVDNDGDGDVDCRDTDCAGIPPCP